MLFRDFDVYDDNGRLLETVPAILYGGGRVNVTLDEFGNPRYSTVVEIVAQVPPDVTQVDFLDVNTGEILATVPVADGRAVLEIDWRRVGTLQVRVGPETKTKLNEAVVEGYVE